jgi:hypothetical protein
MDLRAERIDQQHVMPKGQQVVGQALPDESKTTRDNNLQELSPVCSLNEVGDQAEVRRVARRSVRRICRRENLSTEKKIAARNTIDPQFPR